MSSHARDISRRRFLASAAGATMSMGALLSACGSSAPTSSSTQEETLNVMGWILTDNSGSIPTINSNFHKANANVTVKWSNFPTDQYQTVLKTRIASGDAPDVFGLFPGTVMYPYASAGAVMDLSNEPWAANISQGARKVASYHGKLYGLPIGEASIGVTYNKDIFSKLNLSIPTNWDEFLQVCQKIKDAGIIPIALGNKDMWVDQLIPYAMAPSAIYRDNINFDDDMYAGSKIFAGSAWKQMMLDYLDLNKRGFFNQGSLGTTYNQTVQLMAAGKTAMVVNGTWIVAPIQQASPSINLGMFALPYAEAGKAVWVPAAVTVLMGISSKTKHLAEAKRYLEFWSQPDNMTPFLTKANSFSTFTNITPQIAGPTNDMNQYIKVGTYSFLDQSWPVGVQDTMQKDIQSVFAGSMTVDQMLQNMDSSFQANKSKSS